MIMRNLPSPWWAKIKSDEHTLRRFPYEFLQSQPRLLGIGTESPIKKEVIITMFQSNWAVQKDGLVLKITFILSIKYLSIFLTRVIITKQFLSTLVTLMRMWFMSISTRAVLTLAMENGWTVLQSFSTRVTFILHFSVLRSKSYYRWDVEKVERNILITGRENYAKTFPLKPMEPFFDTFCTPKNKYAWIGLD